ncbi:MAG: aminotransferase, partial [Pseudomonas sp.]
EYSAGFTFMRVKDQDPDALAAYLNHHRIVVDAVDRDVGPVLRMAPGLLNNEQEIDRAMDLLIKAI